MDGTLTGQGQFSPFKIIPPVIEKGIEAHGANSQHDNHLFTSHQVLLVIMVVGNF